MRIGITTKSTGAIGLLMAMSLLLVACSAAEPPSTPVTLLLPSRIDVAAIDAGKVFDAVAAYAADAGLTPDPANVSKATGVFTSQRVRCAPNGDERHTGWCVFRFTTATSQVNSAQTTVYIKVVVPERVKYDPQAEMHQISIESTIDRLSTRLSDRVGPTNVAETDRLTF